MREFFRGWKRKSGVVTLMLACWLTAMWVRSAKIEDEILFPVMRSQDASKVAGTLDGLMSTGGAIAWARLPVHHEEIAEIDHIFPYWQSGDITVDFDGKDYERNWKVFGFGVYVAEDRGEQAKYLVMPYWSITLPLTLISGWLLLSKTRVAKTRPVIEPEP